MNRYFKRVLNADYILEWKYEGLSDKSIKSPSAPNNFLTPKLSYYSNKFNGSCLKQYKATYTYVKIVNIYIVYEIITNYNTTSIQH